MLFRGSWYIATTLLKQHARREATAWKGMVASIAADVVPDAIDFGGARMDADVCGCTRAASATSPGYLWRFWDAWVILITVHYLHSSHIPGCRLPDRIAGPARLSACFIATDKEIFHGRTDTAPQRS